MQSLFPLLSVGVLCALTGRHDPSKTLRRACTCALSRAVPHVGVHNAQRCSVVRARHHFKHCSALQQLLYRIRSVALW
jgi:hypothetical protein